jgi:hypothetical protein
MTEPGVTASVFNLAYAPPPPPPEATPAELEPPPPPPPPQHSTVMLYTPAGTVHDEPDIRMTVWVWAFALTTARTQNPKIPSRKCDTCFIRIEENVGWIKACDFKFRLGY